MSSFKYSDALNEYIQEFLNNPNTIPDYKVNFLKNHFYSIIENYIDIKRDNLLIGTTSKKKYLYFQCKLNKNLHFLYNINNPSCNYLRFDFPCKFFEKLNSDELHYKKYKNLIIKNKKIYKKQKVCQCRII
mgnify:CR=1 FL=1